MAATPENPHFTQRKLLSIVTSRMIPNEASRTEAVSALVASALAQAGPGRACYEKGVPMADYPKLTGLPSGPPLVRRGVTALAVGMGLSGVACGGETIGDPNAGS